jgi:hypothetical protein
MCVSVMRGKQNKRVTRGMSQMNGHRGRVTREESDSEEERSQERIDTTTMKECKCREDTSERKCKRREDTSERICKRKCKRDE